MGLRFGKKPPRGDNHLTLFGIAEHSRGSNIGCGGLVRDPAIDVLVDVVPLIPQT